MHPTKAVPQPSRNDMVEGHKEHNHPAWMTLVVSESEESVDELSSSSRVQESHPLKPKRKLLQKHRVQKTPDGNPMISTVSRPKVRQVSSRISPSGGRTDTPSLQEVLQATFNNNGSFNISPSPPAATPIDNESSCADLTAPPRKRRLVPVVEITLRRSRSEQPDTVLDTSLANSITGTAVPKAVSRKVAPISYESVQDVIDAALDTRVASITWRSPSYTPRITAPTKRVPFEDGIFDFDDDLQGDGSQDERRALPLKLTRMLNHVQHAAVPQQSSGEGFNERLYAMFGDTNRPHSPTPEGNDRATADSTSAFTLAREPTAGKASCPVSSSGSTTSDTSLAQNTEVTSVTSDRHDVSKKRSYAESHLEDGPIRKKQKIEVDEDKIPQWVAALQRLAKGKMKIDHKGMDHLNLVLAEIETVYPHMDSKLAWVSSLQDALKQVAQLEYFMIPFKDEHRLRRRAKDILAGVAS